MLAWRRINECYLVSSDGKVKSLRSGKILVQEPSGRNGRYKRISTSIGGVVKKHLVHRLVATAFIRPPKKNEQVNHKDGDTTHNHWNNLEWVTALQNVQHAFKTLGRKNKGQHAPSAKLTNKNAALIRRLASSGWTRLSLAIRFQVGKTTISAVVNRRTFKEI